MEKRPGTISLTKEKYEQIDNMLKDFCIHANTIWTILATASGQLLAQHGFTLSFDVLTIAALACGVFNSTRELAHLVGDKKFSQLLQEGKAMSLYYINIKGDYLLVSLFDDRTLPGVVRVASEDFSLMAEEVLDKITL